MHQSGHTGSGVGFLPAMYSFSGPTSLTHFDFGTPCTSDDLQKPRLSDRYAANIDKDNSMHKARGVDDIVLSQQLGDAMSSEEQKES